MEPAPALLRDAADSLWRHGYARLPGLLPPRLHRPLARRLLQLRQAGVPAVGIFRDGATWQAAAQVMPVAIHFLGHRCAMLPNLWAMALLPGRLGSHGGARGWPPHVDYPGLSALDGKVPYAISLSFWLALSDTGPDNACMHVRPQIGMRGAEPVHGAAIALPARAGDVLMWRQDLPHWGGRMTRRARGPRLSIALEFQDAGWPPLDAPLLDPQAPPPFAERTRLIDRQRQKYRHIAAPQKR